MPRPTPSRACPTHAAGCCSNGRLDADDRCLATDTVFGVRDALIHRPAPGGHPVLPTMQVDITLSPDP